MTFDRLCFIRASEDRSRLVELYVDINFVDSENVWELLLSTVVFFFILLSNQSWQLSCIFLRMAFGREQTVMNAEWATVFSPDIGNRISERVDGIFVCENSDAIVQTFQSLQ